MGNLIVLLTASLIAFAVGTVWTLALRGHTTRRKGTEVGAEMMEEKMARRAFHEGRASLGRKAWFWGKGWAIEREAAFSYAEIKAMWRKGSWGGILPMGLLMVGMLGSIILGGLLLLLTLSTPIPGILVVAAGLYGAWLVGAGIRRA